VKLPPVRCGEGYVREHVGFGLTHERTDRREALSDLIGDCAPLSSGLDLGGLGEDGAHDGGDHLPLALGDVDEHISHEVHSAALPRWLEEFRDGRLQSL